MRGYLSEGGSAACGTQNQPGLTAASDGTSANFGFWSSFLVSFNSRIRPFSKASVNSWLNRSLRRIMVSPISSPSSLNSSTRFTARQWAMCRSSPSPKKPFNIPLQARSPTCPLCKDVTGRPLILCCFADQHSASIVHGYGTFDPVLNLVERQAGVVNSYRLRRRNEIAFRQIWLECWNQARPISCAKKCVHSPRLATPL